MKGPSFSLLGLTLINVSASVIVLCSLSTTRAQAAPTPAQSVRTQRLELLDASGQVRGQFFVEASGEAVFRMRDETGQIRVKLGASSLGAGFILMDDATEPAVQMLAGVSSLTNRRETAITLRDGDAKRTLTAQD